MQKNMIINIQQLHMYTNTYAKCFRIYLCQQQNNVDMKSEISTWQHHLSTTTRSKWQPRIN